MKELEEQATKSIRAMHDSGKIKDLIDAQIGDTIADIIKRQLGSYSDFGKALREYMTAQLQFDVEGMGASGYNAQILELIKAKLDQAIDTTWKAKLEAEIDDILRAAPKTIKVSELLQAVRDDNDSYDAEAEKWQHASAIVDPEKNGSRWIGLDPSHKPRGPHGYRYRLLVNEDGKLSAVMEEGETAKALLAGTLHGFARLLFQLQSGGSVIEFDLKPGEHESELYDWAEREDY